MTTTREEWSNEVRRRLYKELPVEVLRRVLMFNGAKPNQVDVVVFVSTATEDQVEKRFCSNMDIAPSDLLSKEVIPWAQQLGIC